MRLKRVRIFGFKTFADRTDFDVEGDIIAVVGPNGCGKSNFVDAVLWGLGEASAKHLRASTGQDVIFSGSARRKAVGYAEVSLLFDNEDGALPIDTPEVLITRRLTRAGESEYSINRQTCRQRDIFELLADSGLGRSGYAIVGQKEIDQALAASPEERRNWVDEAAGVQRYRARKVEALRRLSAAEGHLQRVEDITGELEAQREPLRVEAEVATRYKQVLSALRSVETGYLIEQVASAIREMEGLDERIEKSQELAWKETERTQRLEERLERTGRAISELESQIDGLRGLQQANLTASERAEASIQLCEQRLSSLDELEENLGEEAGHSKRQIEEAAAETETLQNEAAAERESHARIMAECEGADGEAAALRRELESLEAALAEARKIHALRLRSEAESAHREMRKKEALREIQGIEQTIPELEKAVHEVEEEHRGYIEAIEALRETRKDLEGRIAGLRKEEELDAARVRASLAERASLEGRMRGIQATIEAHEGLNQGARAVLEAAAKGVLSARYLAVAESVEVDPEHAVALETALGGAGSDLIVEDERDAKEAIRWLKEHRLGRATFQPIPLMRPPEVGSELSRLTREPGVIGRASELARCEPRHRPVFDSLLGRILVVENLDTALRLAKTRGWSRLVTLEGEVVHSGGAVTGGTSAHRSHGAVQRKAELAALEKELRTLGRIVDEFEARSAERDRTGIRWEQEIAELVGQIEARAADESESRGYLQTLQNELSATQRGKERLVKEMEQLDGTSAPDLEERDLPGLETARDEMLKQLAARTAEIEGAAERMAEAEARLRQAESRLQAAERKLLVARETDLLREKKLGNLEPEREKLRAERTRCESERAQALEAKAKAEARLAAAQTEKKDLLEQSYTLNEELKSARESLAALGDGAHQAELNRARADARRGAAQQRLFEEYGLTEEDALAQEGMHEVPADAPQLVHKLRKDLKSMGDVNLGAIEAYERLTQRYEELTEQRADILGGIEQVQASISELDKLTRERFLETYARLEEAFQEVFGKLFKGGEGQIRLTHPDSVLESGIEIDVTLPGKKKQQLQLLSGGERALCATAFLFSLLKVKPTPLTILDEVDAPLDGRNVERFAALLKEFSEQIQFIVITHNPTTIEIAPVWLGVTMQEPGVSTLVPTKMREDRKSLPDNRAEGTELATV